MQYLSPETVASIWTHNISYNLESVAPKPLVESQLVFYWKLTHVTNTDQYGGTRCRFHLVLSAFKIPELNELNSHQKQAIEISL